MLPRLSLDAIRVPGSAFYFAFSLAFISGIYFVNTSHQTESGRNSRPRLSFFILLFVRVYSGHLFCQCFSMRAQKIPVFMRSFRCSLFSCGVGLCLAFIFPIASAATVFSWSISLLYVLRVVEGITCKCRINQYNKTIRNGEQKEHENC